MHNVYSDGLVTIWWNTSATFRVFYAGARELLAFTHYGIETLEQAQAAARQWYMHGGGETVSDYLTNA